MNNIETNQTYQSRFLALRKIINSWNLIPDASKDEFNVLSHQVLTHLYAGADFEKIWRVLDSELAIKYGLIVGEKDVLSFARETCDWWDSNEGTIPVA